MRFASLHLTIAALGLSLILAPARSGLAQEHGGHTAPTDPMPGMTMPKPPTAPAGTPARTPAPPTVQPPTVQGTQPAATGPAGIMGTTPRPAEEPPPDWPRPINDTPLNSFLQFDLLEFQLGRNVRAARWDILGWYGSDTDRIWFKSEGRYNGATRNGDGDLQVLYGRQVSPFIDAQAGFRWEQQLSWDSKRGRAFAVVGIQGLIPFGMELEASAFLSQHGDISARVTLVQDFLLTQHLILQPRFEMNVAAQSVPNYGVGSGINDIELGLRLRYEIAREFAPYVGVSWLQTIGKTATLRANGGESTSVLQFVGGVRMWF